MKSFFQTLFATFLALVLFSIIAVLLSVGIFIGITRLVSRQEPKVENGSFLVLDLSVNLTDAPVSFESSKALAHLLGRDDTESVSLRALLAAIHAAADDKRIGGIFLHGSFTPEGYGAGFAALKEVREALQAFRESKKPIIAYLVGPTTRDYYVASVAETIYVNPYGEMDLPGLASTPTFFKEALDKYGIGIQVVRHGKYKSAVEPFLTDKMSPENREQTQKLLDDVWGQFVLDVGTARNRTPEQIQALVDAKGIITPEDAKAAGLIDDVAYLPDVIEKLRARAGTDEATHTFHQVDIGTYVDSRVGKAEAADNPLAATAFTDTSPKLAIVYAEGEIVDGESEKVGVVGGDRYARVLRKLRQDPNVKAIVLRVNSPGGSGLASEVIQHELTLARAAGKKVVVSMGTVAASGGYWISTAADQVFAEPNTITGSIGVFGLLPNFQKLANDHGVTFDEVRTGKFAALQTATRPKTPEEFAAMQALVEDFYKKFVNKVAVGRNLPAEKVDEIGQGRVWSGNEALKLGLVDKLGGLNDAMNYAREKGGLGNDAKIVEFPVPRDLPEQLAMALSGKKEQETSAGANVLRELSLGPRSGALGRSLEGVQSDLRTLTDLNDPVGAYARMPFDLRLH